MEQINIRVAIVDDDQSAIDNLISLLKQYEKENDLSVTISTFKD